MSVGVIRDRKLLLCKTEMLSNTLALCLLFLAYEGTGDRYNEDEFTVEKRKEMAQIPYSEV